MREVAQKDAGEGPADLSSVVVGEGLEGGAVRRGGAELVRGDVGDEDLEPGVRQGDVAEGCGPVEELVQGGVEVLALLRPDGVHEQLTEHAAVLPPLVVVLVFLDLKEVKGGDDAESGGDDEGVGDEGRNGTFEVHGEEELELGHTWRDSRETIDPGGLGPDCVRGVRGDSIVKRGLKDAHELVVVDLLRDEAPDKFAVLERRG